MPSSDWRAVLAALRDESIGDAPADLMNRALLLGHDVAPGTVGCSLTEVEDDATFRTPAASSPLAIELDEAQYADSVGPCLDAARDRQPVQVDIAAAESRFPAFSAAATRHGVRNSLSVPVPGRPHRTALNLYSTQGSSFGSDRARGVADLLARMIGSMSVREPVGAGVDLASAEADGERVSAAIETLMRERGVSRARAFALLVDLSRARGLGMLPVAEAVLSERGDEP